jgi:hypothetical protein
MDKTIKILLILFTVVGVGLVGYYWINQWHTATVQQAVEDERAGWAQRVVQLEDQIEQLAVHVDTPEETADLVNVFGLERPTDAVQLDAVDCKRVIAQTAAFFQYIDSKGYMIWPGVSMRAEEMFEEGFRKLAANPPTNVGEMNNLYGLLRNVTHFYRVLGKDQLSLMKQIIDNEDAVLEPAMAVLFSWVTLCDPATLSGNEKANLKTVYEYSAFFLNTLGGRSYLLRRDSKMRMLVNYYALLAVDMANDTGRNIFGIDIRPHIDYLFYDINNQRGLLYRERYLTRLAALRDKYM